MAGATGLAITNALGKGDYRETIYLKTCSCTGKKEHHEFVVDGYRVPRVGLSDAPIFVGRRFYRCTKCRRETKFEEPATPPPNVIDLDDV